MLRRTMTSALLFICMLVFVQNQAAVAQPPKKTYEIINKTIPTADGVNLSIMYYRWENESNTPVVVLLHMKNNDKLVWKNGFADTLAKEGYAVIAVDLRKHGESKGANADKVKLSTRDYANMATFDIEAVKQFIFAEHMKRNLNMRKMAIIAPEMSAPLALNYAVYDWSRPPYDDGPTLITRTPRGQDIRALVLISPDKSLPGVRTIQAIRILGDPAKNIAMLICAGEKEAKGYANAKLLHSQLESIPGNRIDETDKEALANQRIFLKTYPYKFKGTELLGKKQSNLKIEEHMLNFLNRHIKSLKDPWVDRRNRYDRDK